MGVPHDADARRFHRVAFQRLEDGELMLKLGRAQTSIYLAGYAVECALKALLLERTPAPDRADVLRSFRGAAGHDLLRLRQRLARMGVHMPADRARAMAFVSAWSTELRYNPSAGSLEEAREFIRGAASVLEWADRSI